MALMAGPSVATRRHCHLRSELIASRATTAGGSRTGIDRFAAVGGEGRSVAHRPPKAGGGGDGGSSGPSDELPDVLGCGEPGAGPGAHGIHEAAGKLLVPRGRRPLDGAAKAGSVWCVGEVSAKIMERSRSRPFAPAAMTAMGTDRWPCSMLGASPIRGWPYCVAEAPPVRVRRVPWTPAR